MGRTYLIIVRHIYKNVLMGRESANSFISLHDVLIYCGSKKKESAMIYHLKHNMSFHINQTSKGSFESTTRPYMNTFYSCTFWTELICIVTSCCWHSPPLPPCLIFPLCPPVLLPPPLPRSLLADAPYSLAPGPSVRESNSHPVIIRFAGVPTLCLHFCLFLVCLLLSVCFMSWVVSHSSTVLVSDWHNSNLCIWIFH